MEKRNLWVLLGKQLNGEITAKERIELQQLLSENGHDLSYLIEFLEHTWGERGQIQNDAGSRKRGEQWEKLSEGLFGEDKRGIQHTDTYVESAGRKTNFTFSFWYKIAAAVIIVLGITVYFIRDKQNRPPVSRKEIVVKSGAKKHIELPDGTSVWLNADSRLSYNSGFAGRNREVWLEGEALFDVKKDASVPFMVRTSGITIQVLGTVFNVEAYKDEPDVQTTLINGKVQVSLNEDPEKKIVLSPREKLIVMSGTNTAINTVNPSGGAQANNKTSPLVPAANKLKYQVQTLPADPTDSSYYAETAWVNDKLAFVYETFGSVAEKMERRYNVHILFKDKDLKKVVMSGVFEKETVGQALQVLQMITRFQYQTAGDTIYLYK